MAHGGVTRLVWVLNGPNLGLLGQRQPHIYGRETLADVERDCRALGDQLRLDVRFQQSNAEAEMIDLIQAAGNVAGGIVINPGGLTFTSVAMRDALACFDKPVMEVHIANSHQRETFRHHSFISARADGVLAGFGTQGYQLALRRMAELIAEKVA